MSDKSELSFRKEDFWLDNLSELYKDGNYLKFFPRYKSTRLEQLNAITRFCIYLILLILMFSFDPKWLYFPITLIVFVVIFYNVNKNDDEWRKKELDKILTIRKNERDATNKETMKQFEHDEEKKYNKYLDAEDEYNQNYILEAGYRDAEGNIIAGEKTEPPKYKSNPEESLFTVDEIKEYERNTCRKPKKDNPFMNPSIVDYNTENPPAACNIDDEYIDDSMAVNFNHELFRDIDDLWERKNSQRQFYTVPNTTIPNNQTEFAKWLYKIPDESICKVSQYGCGNRYDDLRTTRYDNYN